MGGPTHRLSDGPLPSLAEGGVGPGEEPSPVFSQLTGVTGAVAAGADAELAGPGPGSSGGPRLRVLVVGGSMGGSCAALALLEAGCEVQVRRLFCCAIAVFNSRRKQCLGLRRVAVHQGI